MAHEKQTLGQSIDQVLQALEPLDESARKTALLAVCSHLKINVGQMSGVVAVPSGTVIQGVTPNSPQNLIVPASSPRMLVDIRALKEEKKPTSSKQMACLVAYYLQEHAPETERKDTVSASDLEKYFKQAGFKLPQHLQQVLPDAKSSGYFDSGTRGEYKLNAVGYNLVVHNLPSNTAGG